MTYPRRLFVFARTHRPGRRSTVRNADREHDGGIGVTAKGDWGYPNAAQREVVDRENRVQGDLSGLRVG